MIAQTLQQAAPICLIAGRGGLPLEIIAALKRQGAAFRVIALYGWGETQNFPVDAVLPIDKWGQFQRYFKDWQIRSVVFAGKIDRPNILTLRPDMLLLRYLPKLGLGKLGDDAVMQRMLEIFQQDFGVDILSPQNILNQCGRSCSSLGQYVPKEAENDDIHRGLLALKAMSQADFGQAIAVEGGVILGVEAIEGTDALIVRTKQFKQRDRAGVIVKMPKFQQDNRIDLPTIGTATIQAIHQAGYAGLAISAEDMVIVDEPAVVALADCLGLFLSAVRYPEGS
ncbi:MAG: UDP-2,3-diacylglucosamine diphosphatase LpxI [Alphaproteobacteria bacterium]|nr:UDP-2,3-diacylglucosamine diphosphatase LpxI [Alphaproteobacteria bacterium]